MTITFINYADKAFKRHQHFSLKMATKRGKFDKVIGYSKVDIEPEFYEKNRIILDYDKGGGYWLWKPYFILKTLYNLSENDYLFYSDAGAFFLQSVGPLISEIAKSDQDIMGYELPFIERQWTKKELFINMNCDKKQYYNTNQIGSSFILIRKTPFSVTFFQNFLSFACIAKNITDIHKDNIYQESDFIEQRHDQSIFSLLYKKNNLRTFKDPSQLGTYPEAYSGNLKVKINFNETYKLNDGKLFRKNHFTEDYQTIIFHNRRSNPLIGMMKYYSKRYINKLISK